MGSLSSFHRGVKYLLSMADVFTKYFWVKPLTSKKVKTVLYGFIRIENKSKHKPNKLSFDQRREFYNNLMQKWFDDNVVLLFSTYNEVAE